MRLLVLCVLMLLLVAFVLMQRRAVVETAAAGFPVLPFVEQSGGTMPTAYRADLPDRGIAPELSNTAWLNTERPLRLADLRGQVVLLEFWTFDCINCIRTIPYVQRWHETYADQGLVVIGNHYPEFGYEREINNVVAAAAELGITYPIAQDNERETWDDYNQRYWPTIYLIDKTGHIRYLKFGEGDYDITEANIRALLAETYVPEAESTAEAAAELRYLTPTEGLNVRTGAGTQSDQIGTIAPGMVFVILGEENGWYQINYNGGEGYVSADFVTVSTQ